MLLRFVYISIAIELSYSAYGQDYVMKGNAAYNTGNYAAAIEYYSKYDKIANDPDILERRGNSYYKTNELPKAVWDYTRAKKIGNDSPLLYLKMAEIKQHLGELDEATFFYNTFIEEVGPEHTDYNRAVIELKNCVYTAFNNRKEEVASVQSFGSEVNTQYDEIYPLQSPRYGNVYYLSSNRNLKDFNLHSYSINEKGDWQAEQEFVKSVNTAKHDYLQDISPDGQSLLYQKHGAESADRKVTFSTYNGDEELQVEVPRSVLHNIEDLQIVNHNTLAFSSKNLEGHGGYDIYTISYKDGKWSQPMNAGPQVNTLHDDRFPFYSTTLKELHFSSNRPYGFGGYDVYHLTDIDNEGVLENIGQPINSAGDDINFRIDNVGHTAVFSSDRKTGEGGFDLYFAYMKKVDKREPKDSIRFQFLTDVLAQEEESKKMKQEAEKAKILALQEKQRKEKEESDRIAKEKAEKAKQLAEAERLKNELLESKANDKVVSVGTTTELEDDSNIEQKTSVISTASTKSLQVPTEAKVLATDLYDIKTLESIQSYVIYYQDRQDLLNDENKPIVHAIAYKLDQNPDHRVKLLVYTDYMEPGLPEFVQYNTLLRANTISDYLLDLGIDPSRVLIESLSANYPIAKETVAGQPNEEYIHLNKRIEIEFLNDNGQLISDHSLDPTEIPLHSRDRKYILFKDIREELYYSIQIAESPRIFKNAILRFYNDIYVRREKADGNNDYYIGMYKEYEDALELKKQIEKSTTPLSKIVAFYKGSPIIESDIQALTSEYPDLSQYQADLN